MIDDIVEPAVAATVDAIDNAAKRHRWVRILKIAAGILCMAVVVAAIYVTFKYS